MDKQKQTPPRKLTTEEAREIGVLGGKASAKSRQEKKRIQAALEKALCGKYKIDNLELDGYNAMAVQIVKKALMGDVQAFKEIRDTVGEKPKETTSHEFKSDAVIRISKNGTNNTN